MDCLRTNRFNLNWFRSFLCKREKNEYQKQHEWILNQEIPLYTTGSHKQQKTYMEPLGNHKSQPVSPKELLHWKEPEFPSTSDSVEFSSVESASKCVTDVWSVQWRNDREPLWGQRGGASGHTTSKSAGDWIARRRKCFLKLWNGSPGCSLYSFPICPGFVSDSAGLVNRRRKDQIFFFVLFRLLLRPKWLIYFHLEGRRRGANWDAKEWVLKGEVTRSRGS